MVVTLALIIIVGHYCYQIHRQRYPISFFQG
jgi:hypothetical protein